MADALPGRPGAPSTQIDPHVFPFHSLLRPVTLLIGPFGSGKTEIALNLALGAAAAGAEVTLVDLDTVTPAVRSRQAGQVLAKAGVQLVAPTGQLAYADLPTLPGGVHGALSASGRLTIVDVGGNPTGAKVLATLGDALDQRVVHCWGVVSPWRPDAGDAAKARESLLAIAARGRVRLTGVAGNLHFPAATNPDQIRAGWRVIAATAEALDLPVAFCAARRELAGDVRKVLTEQGRRAAGVPVLPLRLIMRPPWEAGLDDMAWHWSAF